MKPSFLIDCDGTLYHGNAAIEYAAEFIEYLNKNEYTYLLLTNCPLCSSGELSLKLQKIGMAVPDKNIMTSGMVTAKVLKKQYTIKSVYVIGSEAFKNELRKQGICVVEDDAEAVVIGYDPQVDYDKMSKAVQLVHGGAALFSTNADNCIPVNETIVPHTGAITAAVECACGQKAITFGKPEHYMADCAADVLSVPKNQLIVIGDRVDTDVAFAVHCGIPSYLVLTGLHQQNKEEISEVVPTRVFRHLGEVIHSMKENEV